MPGFNEIPKQAGVVRALCGLLLVKLHLRCAIAFLVAAVHQRVERERVVVGSGFGLLDQHTHHPPLDSC